VFQKPQFLGGNGIEPAPLRAMLNDCAGARLIWAERNGRKVYYGLTGQGEKRGAAGWMDALGVRERGAA
jgi:hypothetical protein